MLHALPVDSLGAVDDAEPVPDSSLLMQSVARARAEVEQLTRTDIIITKSKQEEMRAAKRRKYVMTIIRIQFADQCIVQAHFRPNEVITMLRFIIVVCDARMMMLRVMSLYGCHVLPMFHTCH